MNLIYVTTALVILAGCASAPKQNAPANPAYIEDSNKLGHTSVQMLNDLTRAGYNSMLGDTIGAYPYTGALNEATETEKGKKNFDSAEKTKKSIDDLNKLLIADKTCFGVRVTSTGPIEGAMYKNWAGKVEQPIGTFHEVVFTNVTGSESVPQLFVTAAYGGSTWFNFSYACTKNKIDLAKEVSLYMIPQLNDRGHVKLTWGPTKK